jgi:DNA-binding response OmpR family regulator
MPAYSILMIGSGEHPSYLEKRQFEKEGYLVQDASLDFKLPKWMENRVYDLYVLNLDELHLNREDWTPWLSPKVRTPIIVLTASNDDTLAVELLNAGADDIVPRPILINELLARVRAVLRRAQRSYQPQKSRNPSLCLADLTIHMAGRRVFSQEREIRLTRTEFNLFSTLINRLDQVCTHSELLARVWGWEYWDATAYLYVYMGRLRQKLGEHYASLVETVPGIGYTLHSG